MSIFISRRGLAGLGLSSLLPAAVSAQSAWPDRQVRLVVPFGAGGAVDTLSRLVANGFAAHANGQAMVVENRSGAGGAIAGAFVAQSRPDGYTLMINNIGMAASATLYRRLPYQVPGSFAPLGIVSDAAMTVITRLDFPAPNLRELMAELGRKGDVINLATAGISSASNLCGLLVQQAAGAKRRPWSSVARHRRLPNSWPGALMCCVIRRPIPSRIFAIIG